MPVTFHVSSDRACSIGNRALRIWIVPSASTGASSFITNADAMIQRACADPERYVARPLKRYPPSTGSARAANGFSEPAIERGRIAAHCGEYLLGKEPREQRAGVENYQRPARRCVERRNSLEHAYRFRNGQTQSAELGRHEHAEQVRGVKRVDDGWREMSQPLRLGRIVHE